MAPPSKKTNTKSSSSKKKITTRKTPVKKRTPKKVTKNSNFKKNILIVLSVFLMISLVSFGYFLGQYDTQISNLEVSKIHKSKETYSAQQLLNDLSKIKTKEPEEAKKPKTIKRSETIKKVEEKRVVKPLPKKVEEIKKEKKPVKKKSVALADHTGKPKLVIIIDDVSSLRQLKSIRSLPLKVTPSIFPPFKLSPSNHKLAEGLEHYMVHLPMASGKSYDKQYGTLKITDSKEKMQARVKEIRRLFPKARYVNNHTGSAFTNDYKAMEMLYGLLRKEGFAFIDSRTIATSKVRKIAGTFGDAYVARDVFIDNQQNVQAIHKQLRKVVKIAKRKGVAVAIGHPYSMTMKALRSAKNIFKDVELVYIDEIYIKRNK